MFKLKNPHQLLFPWIDGLPYRLGQQTSGKKSDMAEELVDYDFDCLPFCWSSAVCPFKKKFVLIVPSAMKRLPAIHFHLGQTNWEISDLSAGRAPEENGLKKRGLRKPRHISIFHFLTKIPLFCWRFSLLSSIATIWDRKRADIESKQFPDGSSTSSYIPNRQTINKRTNERIWRTGLEF